MTSQKPLQQLLLMGEIFAQLWPASAPIRYISVSQPAMSEEEVSLRGSPRSTSTRIIRVAGMGTLELGVEEDVLSLATLGTEANIQYWGPSLGSEGQEEALGA